MPSMHGTLIQW